MALPSTKPYLLLDVAGETCALPREVVREILPLPHLHAPPAIGGPIVGFLNLGGVPIAVIDLARLLGLGETAAANPHRHLVLSADRTLALLVDRVLDLVAVTPDAIRPIEDRQTLNGCVAAELVIGDALIHALALENILSVEERERVAAHSHRAAERLAAFDPVPA